MNHVTINSFWGIDKVVLNNVHVMYIDEARLSAAEQQYRSGCVVRGGDENHLVLKDIRSIRIFDNHFGGLEVGRTPKGIYCRLTIIDPKKGSVETVNVDGLYQRVADAVDYIRREYGIELNDTYAEYASVEIAFTGVFEEHLPLRPRVILMDCLADARKDLHLIGSAKDRNGLTTVQIKNEKAKKTAVEFILYDKTAEMRSKKEADLEQYPMPVYRFEEKITKKDAIEKALGTVRFKTGKRLTDRDILNHIEKALLERLYKGYVARFLRSVEQAKRFVKMRPTHLKTGWQLKALLQLSGAESNDQCPDIIDIESFIYATPGGDNGSRTVRRIMDAAESAADLGFDKDRNPYARMDGWIVEDVINEMVTALSFGLGMPGTFDCRAGLPVNYENKGAKEGYFRHLRGKSKPRLKTFEALGSKGGVR